jgi:hypothetical protein
VDDTLRIVQSRSAIASFLGIYQTEFCQRRMKMKNVLRWNRQQDGGHGNVNLHCVKRGWRCTHRNLTRLQKTTKALVSKHHKHGKCLPYTQTQTQTETQKRIHRHTYVHIHINAYIHTYMHTYMRIYASMYACNCNVKCRCVYAFWCWARRGKTVGQPNRHMGESVSGGVFVGLL